ncbi:DMT family transporter [Allocoleopsis sp.]|uniref:DMT family transporter n=1 Tax=Allocoleopsis sp. TaxID=3088169 RepID=UPI002FCFB652
MYLLMVLAAAVFFTVGGIFMKLSQGLSFLTPSLLVYVFFCTGASLQTLAMHKSELGVTYILVLGLEAVLALLFGIFIFKEHYSLLKLLGVSLIVVGIIFLRTSNN